MGGGFGKDGRHLTFTMQQYKMHATSKHSTPKARTLITGALYYTMHTNSTARHKGKTNPIIEDKAG